MKKGWKAIYGPSARDAVRSLIINMSEELIRICKKESKFENPYNIRKRNKNKKR